MAGRELEKECFHISYETDRNWVVRTPQGKLLRFQRDTGICHRFPYLDLSDAASLEGYSCGQTMHQNYEGFTTKELEQAILAQKKQIQIGLPSDRECMEMVSRNRVKKPLFTLRGISNARAIFVSHWKVLEGSQCARNLKE